MEEVQMDRWLHVSGARLGQDDGPIGEPRGWCAHTMAAPVEERIVRSQRSVDGPI